MRKIIFELWLMLWLLLRIPCSWLVASNKQKAKLNRVQNGVDLKEFLCCRKRSEVRWGDFLFPFSEPGEKSWLLDQWGRKCWFSITFHTFRYMLKIRMHKIWLVKRWKRKCLQFPASQRNLYWRRKHINGGQ